MKTATKRGRPASFNVDTAAFNVTIPVTTINRIRQLAKKANMPLNKAVGIVLGKFDRAILGL